MSVIATFRVASTDFAIGRAFEALADVSINAEPIVPVSVGLAPYFWLDGGADETALDRFRGDDRVAAATVVDRYEDRQLLRVDWRIRDDEFADALTDTSGVVLEATREATGEWTFRLRFDDYDSLSAFNSRCLDRGIALDLEEIYDSGGTHAGGQADLTPSQQEVLLAAIEGGYFEVPRETTLVELGEKLAISDSAASQRLRRGLETLVSASLSENRDGTD